MNKLSSIIFPYKIEQWNEKSHLWFFYNCYPTYEMALSSYNILKSENKSIYRIIKVLDISRK